MFWKIKKMLVSSTNIKKYRAVFLYANESCEKAVLHQTLKMTKKGCDKSCVTPFFVFTYFVPNKRSPASPSPGTI
ncbi:hypothetical protein F6X79_10880 [Enterococcus faecium]|nr:hypothetical protein F6X79_10880 [Enterococcus faecium]